MESDKLIEAMAQTEYPAMSYEELATAALNALRDTLEPVGWQPIDTAPEDGDMLVRNGDMVAVAFRDSGMSSYRFFSPATQSDLQFGPTEWMPIPTTPVYALPEVKP